MQSIWRHWYLEQLFQFSGPAVTERARKQWALSKSHWIQWRVSFTLVVFGLDSQHSCGHMILVNLLNLMKLREKLGGKIMDKIDELV